LNIQVLNECCARIEVSSEECDVFGIDYDSFSGSDTASRLFIASVLRRITEMGPSTITADKLTAEIFKKSSGGLIVYLSGKGMKLTKREGERVLLCDTPEQVISTLKSVAEPESAELYKYCGRYALLCREYDREKMTPQYFCEKIKEYGELISDTPFMQLYGFIDPEDR